MLVRAVLENNNNFNSPFHVLENNRCTPFNCFANPSCDEEPTKHMLHCVQYYEYYYGLTHFAK